MAFEFKNKIDISDFSKDMSKLRKKKWPEAIAIVFSNIAKYSLDQTQAHTRSSFNLHTDYIPRGIRAVPVTDSQRKKAAKSLAKYYDMFAAVYLRGSNDPSKSLEFMAQHEDGYKRKPHSAWASLGGEQYLAQPGPTRFHDESKTKTKRGATRKRFKPGAMFEQFRAAGSVYDETARTTITRSFKGRRRRGSAKLPGSWFVIKPNRGKNITAIARRTDKVSSTSKGNLEIMWWLTKSQTIDKDFGFHRSVMGSVMRRYPTEAKLTGSRVRL